VSDVPINGNAGARWSVRRLGWGLGDQMLSSATNFTLGVLVARAVTPHDFGAFSLVFAIFTLSLGATRAGVGEPLIVRFSSVPVNRWREGTRLSTGTALMIGCGVGLGCVVTAALYRGGTFSIVLAILGVSLPALLIQDTVRYSLFAGGRGGAAFLNDLAWAIAMFGAIGLLMHAGLHSVGWLTLAWAGSGMLAASLGLFQLGVVPSGLLGAIRWVRWESDLAPRFLAEFAVTVGASNLILFGVGGLAGLAQLGQLRAGQIALGPLNVMFLGAGMATVPEGVRLLQESTARLRQASLWISLMLGACVCLWGALVLALPARVGELFLGANWEGARSLVLPLSIGALGYGLSFGPMTGLRSLAAAKRSLRARSLDSLSSVVFVLAGASLGGALGAAQGGAIAGCLRIPNWWWHFTKALREHERIPAANQSTV
jgi:O-antigen/teichoic acid export membrane protein